MKTKTSEEVTHTFGPETIADGQRFCSVELVEENGCPAHVRFRLGFQTSERVIEQGGFDFVAEDLVDLHDRMGEVMEYLVENHQGWVGVTRSKVAR